MGTCSIHVQQRQGVPIRPADIAWYNCKAFALGVGTVVLAVQAPANILDLCSVGSRPPGVKDCQFVND